MIGDPISVAQIAADLDEARAHLVQSVMYLDELRSTVHDILTGSNDVWAKRQLIALVDATEASVKRALQ